ncbi:MAG TPA: acylphosphatase [Rectinemataceae bacterium]|nr:acylphosphatase [Rectinemataceae bacterium]
MDQPPTARINQSTRSALHAIVQGRVQGVGFRFSAAHKARSLGLAGWVRNLDNGDVETWAEGGSEALADFEDWLEIGPPGARVDRLIAQKREPTGNCRDFEIEG